jgi:hypothetical protein
MGRHQIRLIAVYQHRMTKLLLSGGDVYRGTIMTADSMRRAIPTNENIAYALNSAVIMLCCQAIKQ